LTNNAIRFHGIRNTTGSDTGCTTRWTRQFAVLVDSRKTHIILSGGSMENNNKPNRIHPLVGAAAASVVLVSLVGVAAITGILPNSRGNETPVAVAAPVAQAPAVVAQATPAPVKAPTPSNNGSYVQQPARVTQASYDSYEKPVVVARAPAACNSCGRVESVRAVETQKQASGLGIAAGAVVGGLLGNQVGGGNGRTLATVAGAVGGGYAGNEVEKRTGKAQTWTVRVRMENGTMREFPYNNRPDWNKGDRVRVVDGYLTTRS
jgi:outer membrane lipoprotein SlyB